MKNLALLFIHVLSILFSGFMFSLAGQTVPAVYMSLSDNSDLPSSMGSPVISIGTASSPASDIIAIQFAFSYDTLLDLSNFDLGGSNWDNFFNPDGDCEISLVCDKDSKTLDVEIWRPSGLGKSGYGEVLRLGGVGIIDNIDLKSICPYTQKVRQAPMAKPVFQNNGSNIVFSPASPGLAVVRSLDGRSLIRQEMNAVATRIDISGLAPGIYVLLFDDGGSAFAKKFLKRD